MGHIIGVSSQKGGTGKTTTAVNLAAALALFEKRILLVDCDPLGNATSSMGIDKTRLSLDLYHVLMGDAEFKEVLVETNIDFLHVLPARHNLRRLDNNRSHLPEKEMTLRLMLQRHTASYDFIIIDSPASSGFLALSAMIAADWLVIPLQYQVYALEGLGQLIAVIKAVRKKMNVNLKIAGLLFTMIEVGGNASGNPVENQTRPLLKGSGTHIFSTVIPWDRKLRNAANYSKPLVFHDLTSRGARAHLDLSVELLDRLKQKQ